MVYLVGLHTYIYYKMIHGPYNVKISFKVSDTGIGFSPVTSRFHCHYHSTTSPYSFFITCNSYYTDKWAKPGNL